MGWHIHTNKNTLKISEECAKDLLLADAEENYSCVFEWDESWGKVENNIDYVRGDDGTIQFNDDHMEHMDYLHEAHIQAVLLKHKVNGVVEFLDVEGDNRGTRWSYTFKDGVVKTKEGKI